MKARGISKYLAFGASVSGLGLLGLVVWQLNALERRFAQQNQQLRTLGESTERLASEVKRLQSTPARVAASSAPEDDCRINKILHPEVPNFLSAPDTHWPPPGAVLGGTLKRGWPSGDPKGFNRMLENGSEVSEYIYSLADESLAQRNGWTDPNKWHGVQACRIEVTDDFKEFTIYLKRGMKWHQPAAVDLNDPKYAWLKGDHEVTARDFMFAFDLMLNPQVENGFLRNYYEDVESWKAIDDYTFVVRWKKKTYGSITATLDLNALPEFLFAYSEQGERFPKEVMGTRFNRHWYNNKGFVGAGPYRHVSYVPGSSIELALNENYHAEKPATGRLTYGIYTDAAQTTLRMKSGEIAFAPLRPGPYREEVLQWQTRPKSEWPKDSPFLNGKIQCQAIFDTGYFFIGWNQERPWFKDAKVRTAMTLALRRKELVETVFAGLGEVATGPFAPETGGLDPNIDPLDFDLERARKLLTETGWIDANGDGVLEKQIDGKSVAFEFTLLIYGNRPEYTALANIYKEDLLKIGVRLKIDAPEWSLMQKKSEEKDFDAYTGGWSLPWDVDPYQIWHSSQADVAKGSNRIGFRNAEADQIIEELRVTFEPAKRVELMRRLHRLIYEEQATTFLLRRKVPYCWENDVQGVQFAKVRYLADIRPWFVSKAQ